MLKTKPLIFGAILGLSACGSIYTSPKVNRMSDQVKVVQVSLQTIAVANLSTYRPKQLPAVFSRVSSTVKLKDVLYLQDQTAQTYQPTSVSLPPRNAAGPYRLGVSDVVLLSTPTPQTADALTGLIAAQNKRQGYTVQDDGAIAIPDIGRIELAGKTIEEAEATIFQTLVTHRIDPKFSLEITGFNSKSVSIGGAVKRPQLAPITLRSLTLQNALQSAGGIKSATPEYITIRIFRGGKRYQIPLQELSAQPKLQNFVLQDGDSILVEDYFQRQLDTIKIKSQALDEVKVKSDIQRAMSEEARQNFLTKLELGAVKRDYAYITGEVTKQGRFPLPFDNTASVADAIYSDGGIKTREGNLKQIYILRTSGANQQIIAYHLDAGNVINLLLATKMQLRPDDVIFVSEQHVTAWNRVISQILPSLTIVDLAATN